MCKNVTASEPTVLPISKHKAFFHRSTIYLHFSSACRIKAWNELFTPINAYKIAAIRSTDLIAGIDSENIHFIVAWLRPICYYEGALLPFNCLSLFNSRPPDREIHLAVQTCTVKKLFCKVVYSLSIEANFRFMGSQFSIQALYGKKINVGRLVDFSASFQFTNYSSRLKLILAKFFSLFKDFILTEL